MKLAHVARPQYPTYRESSQFTAKHPLAELVAGIVVCILLLSAGLSLAAVM